MGSVGILVVIAALFASGYCQNGVGFTVHLDGEHVLSNNVVIFDKVVSNVGTLYSPTTGEFTCPNVVHGLYHFQLSIKSASLSVAEAQIQFVNGASGANTTIATVRTGDGLDMASNAVTLECGANSGDKVRVIGVSGTLFGDAGRGQVTFTGYGHRLLP